MRHAVRCKRSGKARGLLILLLALLVVSCATAWLVAAGRGRVTAYLKVPRSAGSIIDDTGPEPWDDYRRRRDGMKTLFTTPLVIDAALQNQQLADTYVTRDPSSSLKQLTDSINIEFPNDGEIMQVSLSCKQADAEQAKTILDAVIRSFQEKVMLTQRLEAAARQADFRDLVDEMKTRLLAQLRELYEREKTTPAASDPELTLLKETCERESQLYKKLQLQVVKQELLNKLNARAEATGGSARDGVEVIQPAVIDGR